jgi:type IV secretory pathway VirB2 component (pilin)
MHIPTPNQKQGEEYSIGRLQGNLNTITRVIGLVALGLGLLIGGFLYSSFGLAPIVLLASIILVVVSLPILMRSASALSKHNQIPSRR